MADKLCGPPSVQFKVSRYTKSACLISKAYRCVVLYCTRLALYTKPKVRVAACQCITAFAVYYDTLTSHLTVQLSVRVAVAASSCNISTNLELV